jgi:phosphatidylglycerol---prolipoprotein diacylglyceryl transferase
MIAYPITRFLIEYLRNDEPAFFAGLTISQAISVGLLLCALLYWAWLGTLPVRRESPATSESGSIADEPVEVQA